MAVAPNQQPLMPVGGDGKPIRLIAPFAPKRIFYTDGRIIERQLQTGASLKTKTRRETDGIIIEEDLPFGGKAIQIYKLSPDGERLYVTMRVENGAVRMKVNTVNFVFDRTGN